MVLQYPFCIIQEDTVTPLRIVVSSAF